MNPITYYLALVLLIVGASGAITHVANKAISNVNFTILEGESNHVRN